MIAADEFYPYYEETVTESTLHLKAAHTVREARRTSSSPPTFLCALGRATSIG